MKNSLKFLMKKVITFFKERKGIEFATMLAI